MKKSVALLLCLLLLAGLCGTAFAEVVPQGLPQVYPLTVEDEIIAKAKPAPEACFTSPASENGLEGTLCYLVGKVIRTEDIVNDDEVFHTFVLQTERGYVDVMDFYTYLLEITPADQTELVEEPDSDYSFPEIGEFVKVVAIYSGYSNKVQMPLFYYGAQKSVLVYYDMLNNTSEPDEPSYTPTTGESNALRSANSYLEYSAFSYSGLIDQLEYSGFSHEEAVYAANNCGADWFAQAVKKAESYLKYSAFSRTRLIEQLEYSGFTHEQAVYGAEQNGY